MYILRCEKWYIEGGSGKSGVLQSTGPDRIKFNLFMSF
jgi:hypothetical protein